ncbi:MAG: AraC family transcriptional regulator [Phycisphaeraceae bacterium]|nr:AraC family transcriptional regulator [Phycisphaeraceae bacterium]
MAIDWSTSKVLLSSAGLTRCEPGWRLDEAWGRRLLDFDCWFVWAGRGTMQLDGVDHVLRPGVCFWMRPGHVYLASQDLSDRLGVTFIHFDVLDASGRRVRDDLLPPQPVDMPDVHCTDAMLRRVVTLMTRSRAGNAELATSLLALVLREYAWSAQLAAEGTVSGTQLRHMELAQKLASRIRESPGMMPSIAHAARQAGYSPDHFTRLFKTVIGQSPQDFAVRVRIDRARQLLTETSLSVGEIAQMLGYGDVFFFSRQFKLKNGQTPSGWRNARAFEPQMNADERR